MQKNRSFLKKNRFVTAFELVKCQRSLLTCPPISWFPSNISTLGPHNLHDPRKLLFFLEQVFMFEFSINKAVFVTARHYIIYVLTYFEIIDRGLVVKF